MNKKLTLSLDENIIHQARIYAEAHNESLSHIIEKFLLLLTKKENTAPTIPAQNTIDEITGIISLPEGMDVKEEYKEYRIKKHSND